MAVQLENWNGNPDALSAIPALNKALAGFVLGSPEFNL